MGGRKARGTLLPLNAVQKMRPARDEIIIATGVELRDCGVHLWGCSRGVSRYIAYVLRNPLGFASRSTS